MQEYKIKRGNTKDLEYRINAGFSDIFNLKPDVTNGHYTISYGSMKLLEVWLGEGNKKVIVNTETDEKILSFPDEVADPIILDTNTKFRQFLNLVTGFTVKERIKHAKNVTIKNKIM
ncbi:MAG TPA: DUF5611 family protein, partial [Methanocorpusculum sp.]|nr:DUF5611 family protein [Methanocorpusculum sp.]